MKTINMDRVCMNIIKNKLVDCLDVYTCTDLYTYNSLCGSEFRHLTPMEYKTLKKELEKRWPH